MITCPYCHHRNSQDSSHCEACCSELPTQAGCPKCGQPYLPHAKFCGHCGSTLENLNWQGFKGQEANDVPPESEFQVPEPQPPEPLLSTKIGLSEKSSKSTLITECAESLEAELAEAAIPETLPINHFIPQTAALIHQATQFKILLNPNQSPIHIGKPNKHIMPDINLATFKHSEVVSRVHADILIKDNHFFIQDNGSANGTFVNSKQVPPGKAWSLKSGDRISLGKGNLVTFIFELS